MVAIAAKGAAQFRIKSRKIRTTDCDGLVRRSQQVQLRVKAVPHALQDHGIVVAKVTLGHHLLRQIQGSRAIGRRRWLDRFIAKLNSDGVGVRSYGVGCAPANDRSEDLLL